MGLLGRAANALKPDSSAVGAQDARGTMADALVERILRLAAHETTPYTALSLIKTYVPYRAGFCLRKSGTEYVCYAAIGLETDSFSFSADAFDCPRVSVLTKLGKASDFSFDFIEPEAVLWLFPLGPENDCAAAVVFSEDPLSPLDTLGLNQILQATKNTLLPLSASKHQEGQLSTFIEHAFESFDREGLAVLVFDARSVVDAAALVTTQIASSGVCKRLPGDKLLVLLHGRLDGELVAHRLQKSIGISVIASLEASGSKEALDFLRSYL